MMARSLLIAVRFHEGRYHGQADRFHGADGWPPSPSRVFQALVAGAARGATLPPEDQRALEWLERLDPPSIAAPSVRRGRAVKLYVPNNDLDARGGDPDKVGDIRIDKHWRPCFFDADEPVLYVWSFDSGASEAAGVCAIAAKLYQLGRGVDPAWATAEVLSPDKAARALIVHPGSCAGPPDPVKCPFLNTVPWPVSSTDIGRHVLRRKAPAGKPGSCSLNHQGRDSATSVTTRHRDGFISSCAVRPASPLGLSPPRPP